jgi:dTDP-4-amino-4,6-dideoxygalactose transaminase
MKEIEAAIGSEQLRKLESLVIPRVEAADYLAAGLAELPGISPPVVRPHVRHAYYVFAIRYDASRTGISRSRIAAALCAEGLPIAEGYVEPIYLQPMYQRRIGFGRDGFPFTYPGYKGQLQYDLGTCPITERMYRDELMYTAICHAGVVRRDLDDCLDAFRKVFDNLVELKAA